MRHKMPPGTSAPRRALLTLALGCLCTAALLGNRTAFAQQPKPTQETAKASKTEAADEAEPAAKKDAEDKSTKEALKEAGENVKGISIVLGVVLGGVVMFIVLMVLLVFIGSFPLWLASKILRLKRVTYGKAVRTSIVCLLGAWIVGGGCYLVGLIAAKQIPRMARLSPHLTTICMVLGLLGVFQITRSAYEVNAKKAIFLWIPYALLVGGIAYLGFRYGYWFKPAGA